MAIICDIRTGIGIGIGIETAFILLMRRVGHVLQTIICTTSLRASYFTCA